MLDSKSGQSKAGANCLVPSPTAATLHASIIKYRRISCSSGRRQTAVPGTLERPADIPACRRNLSAPISHRGIEQQLRESCYSCAGGRSGRCCIKVPDIHDVGLMEKIARPPQSRHRRCNCSSRVFPRSGDHSAEKMAAVRGPARTREIRFTRRMAPAFDGLAFRPLSRSGAEKGACSSPLYRTCPHGTPVGSLKPQQG